MPARTSLYGFVGECVRAAGTVCLPITVRDGPEKVTRMVEFLVVDRPYIYNIILGRPILNALKVVVSMYYPAMKFPNPTRVGGSLEEIRKGLGSATWRR